MLTSASSYKKNVIPGALYDDADTESIEANDLLTVTDQSVLGFFGRRP